MLSLEKSIWNVNVHYYFIFYLFSRKRICVYVRVFPEHKNLYLVDLAKSLKASLNPTAYPLEKPQEIHRLSLETAWKPKCSRKCWRGTIPRGKSAFSKVPVAWWRCVLLPPVSAFFYKVVILRWPECDHSEGLVPGQRFWIHLYH